MPHTSMDTAFRQKTNMETLVLNNTLDQLGLIDICKTFHPNAEKHTFFSSVHISLDKSHKSSVTKLENTEITSNTFSNHDVMKLKLNYKKSCRNAWRQKNVLQSVGH